MLTPVLLASLSTKGTQEPARLLMEAMPTSVRQTVNRYSFGRFVVAAGLSTDTPFMEDAANGLIGGGTVPVEQRTIVTFDIIGGNTSLTLLFDDNGHVQEYRLRDPRPYTWTGRNGQPNEEALREQSRRVFDSVWHLGGVVKSEIIDQDELASRFRLKVTLDERRLFDFFNAGQVEICPKNGVATLVTIVRQRPVERRSPHAGELAAAPAEMLPRFLNTFGTGLYRLYHAELTYQPMRPGHNYVPSWTMTGATIDGQGRITGGYELSIHADSKAVIREINLGHPMGRSQSVGPFRLDGVWSHGDTRYRLEPASEDFVSEGTVTLRREHFVLHGNYSKERSLVKIGDAVYRLVPAP
jgi:hypothetical protein